MKSSSVSECKTCHKQLITDWHEGNCIKCARDKVLGDSVKVGEKKRIAYQLGYKEAQAEIGKALWKWFNTGTRDIEDVIEELTGVKQ